MTKIQSVTFNSVHKYQGNGVGKEQYWKLVRQMNAGTTKVLQGEDKDMEKMLSSSSKKIISIIFKLH